ncbi:MAG TPA: FAD-binding oxidoreductase, partial [Patescibacteria group bacterium]|nr:FAD-binding oxidoreductase [Patescibacteria group bacterium]
VYYRDFEKATLAKGWLLPSYPASRELCTVGGMAANNSGGEKSLRYGKTERYVERVKAVLRDGREYEFGPLSRDALDRKMAQQDLEGDVYRRVYRIVEDRYDLVKGARPDVSKNSAGYGLWDVWDRKTFDMAKLFVGSQGTLGILTEVRFRLVKPAAHSKLLVIFLRDFAKVADVANAVLAFGPESFESYDDNTLKFAMRYFGDIAKRMGGRNSLALAWQFLPEAWMSLTGGLPKLVLLAEFTGATETEVDSLLVKAKAALAPFGVSSRITRTETEARKYWVIRRESFNLLRHHLKKLHTAPFIDDFCVRPADLPKFLPELYAILDRYDFIFTVAGHVGDGNFHIIPLMNLADPKTKSVIEELSAKVYALVFKYGGSTTGEHNDGLIRGPYLRAMFGDDVFGLFEEVKAVFDPDGIFNPGKKVGASLRYALGHLKTK